MNQQPFDPGLTQKYDGTLRRAINRDGSFNVHRHGARLSDVNFYQYLLTISWWKFHVFVITAYVFVNAAFAAVYLLIGIEGLQGAQVGSPLTVFLSAFFFSIHTFTTVGYGSVAPHGLGINIVAALEAITGLMSLALATGLLYGRFSKPNARIRFSRNAIVAPYQGITGLEFRIVNVRNTNLMELEATVLMMTVDRSGVQPIRKYIQLSLERDRVYFFPLPWTIVHPIDEKSPLFGKSAADLSAAQTEFLVLIKGFDETFGQSVHVRYSYRYDEVEWGVKFIPAFRVDDSGDVQLDINDIDNTERVPNAS